MRDHKKPNFDQKQIEQFLEEFDEDLPMGYSGLVALVHYWKERYESVLVDNTRLKDMVYHPSEK